MSAKKTENQATFQPIPPQVENPTPSYLAKLARFNELGAKEAIGDITKAEQAELIRLATPVYKLQSAGYKGYQSV